MHFCTFLRNLLQIFENSQACWGLSPPDPPRTPGLPWAPTSSIPSSALVMENFFNFWNCSYINFVLLCFYFVCTFLLKISLIPWYFVRRGQSDRLARARYGSYKPGSPSAINRDAPCVQGKIIKNWKIIEFQF